MGEIPKDVYNAVEAIMAEVDAGVDLSTEQCMARAILAERERAAIAAEQRGAELGEAMTASDIANTIRNPDAPSAPVGP